MYGSNIADQWPGPGGKVGLLYLRFALIRVSILRGARDSGNRQVALPFSPPEEASVVEHVLGEGVQGPVVALAGIPGLPRYFDEAVVEREVVPDAVLPRGELLLVIGEAVPDEVADAAQRQPLVRRLKNGHRDEGDVRVRRLHDAAVLALAFAVFLVRRLVAVSGDAVVLEMAGKRVFAGGLQLAVRRVAARVGLLEGLFVMRRRRQGLKHRGHLRRGRHLRLRRRGGRWTEVRRRQRRRRNARRDRYRWWWRRRERRQRRQRRQPVPGRDTLRCPRCRRGLGRHRRELSLVGGSCRQRRGLLHRPLVPLEREDALDAESAVVHHGGPSQAEPEEPATQVNGDSSCFRGGVPLRTEGDISQGNLCFAEEEDKPPSLAPSLSPSLLRFMSPAPSSPPYPSGRRREWAGRRTDPRTAIGRAHAR